MYVYIYKYVYTFKNFLNFLADWLDGCCWNCSTASFGIFRFTRVNLKWLKLQLRQELCESIILFSPHFAEWFWNFGGIFFVYSYAVPHICRFSPMWDNYSSFVFGGKSGVKKDLSAICRIPSVGYLAIILKIR